MSLMESRVLGREHQLATDDETAFGLAVARALEARHPIHTAGHVAQALRCTKKAAENILAGHLSARTLTWIAKAYGLSVMIEATASVAGQSLENFIIENAATARRERAAAEQREREHQALLKELRQSRPRDPEPYRPSA